MQKSDFCYNTNLIIGAKASFFLSWKHATVAILTIE